MSEFRRDAACVVGIGHSAYGTRGSLAPLGLGRIALDAVLDACADAGLDAPDIDGFAGYCDDPTWPADLAVALGTKEFRYSGLVWGGRGSGVPGAVANAYAAVATGLADYVVVVRSLIQQARLGQSVAAGVQPGQAIPLAASYTAPFGMALPAAIYALKARRHMALYGTTTDQFAEVTINARRNAVNNPDARFREEITVEEHHASRLVCDPLRLLDCCMESDGAAALIVTTPERARDLRHPPVSIRAVATTGEYKWATASFNTIDEDYVSTGHRRAARDLYHRAGLGPDDVDVALFYDGFTPSVIMSLEDWGFCDIGEGGPFVADGGIRREGRLPVNTHGGNLAEVYLQGITHLLEGVRQLRGTAINQIADASVALYASGVGASPGGGVLLSR
ncbi:lipid-transfer protein [Pseudofrankia sp. BMG5.36]|uniref:thiolase C-terminal domain-containing protein n=1 Tax=Pseudofrankia sp. BMG5.36 TaxID=1834512 RepID=UPI0008DA40EC|nr:lipid-transfer protein [Pseudofrankia sp. BMG5.36]OHV74714.1 lipid-transfer protein [Pseudofrankia sp. BMG5.36]